MHSQWSHTGSSSCLRRWPPSPGHKFYIRPKSAILYIGDDYVLRLDVPMSDVLTVQVVDPVEHIPQLVAGLRLLEGLLFPQHRVERAFLHVLQDQVHVLLVIEDAVELEDIGVAEVELHFDLHHQLVLHFVLSNRVLLDLFHGVEGVGFAVHYQVDLPKFALPQVLNLLEVIEAGQTGGRILLHEPGGDGLASGRVDVVYLQQVRRRE